MRVFISGIAGFLGSHLADAWIARGARVTGCDNLSGGSVDNVPTRATFLRLDCNELERLREAMRGAELVYHCAALPHAGLSVFSPWRIVHSVVSATAAMLSAACSNHVGRFVFCSSMDRYGAQPTPFVETMATAAQDPYAIAKVAGEELTKNLCDVHGVEWAIAVPHNIYGPRQCCDPYRNVVAIFMNLMLQKRQPYLYGGGTQRRCFSYVDDCVAPLVQMGALREAAGEVVNIGPDAPFVTIRELAETIAGLLGFPLDAITAPARPLEVDQSNCSADKARALLGYTPRVELGEGLGRMLEWMKLQGPRLFEYRLPIEILTDKTPQTWARMLF